MNANQILFHPSSCGKLMTEPRSKSEKLSETTKTHLIDVYIEQRYGRKKEVTNRFIEKGLKCEEDSITFYSRVTKTFYKKNTEQIRNAFLIGTPDLSDQNNVLQAGIVIDVKSSWDIFTFHAAKYGDLNKMYYWQGQAYMDLTGAKLFKLVYCLIDTPDSMIADEKRRLCWQMGVIDEMANPDYLQACAQIDLLRVYQDIPLQERVHEITIERDDAAIARLHERILDCRQYMNQEFYKSSEPMALAAEQELN